METYACIFIPSRIFENVTAKWNLPSNRFFFFSQKLDISKVATIQAKSVTIAI